MNNSNEPEEAPEDAVTTRTRPRIGRVPGSKNMAMQDRAVRTREAIIAVAARLFDTDGYGNTSINTILATGAFTKGAIYFHFPSKEAIAGNLIADWMRTVNDSTSQAVASGPGTTAGEKLAAIFISLARQITEHTNLRAGMKLTLEPSLDNGAAFTHWVDTISAIIDTAIIDGELTDTPTTHRLGWNLCAGTVGAAQASATLREDIDLATCIEDAVTAQLRNARLPA